MTGERRMRVKQSPAAQVENGLRLAAHLPGTIHAAMADEIISLRAQVAALAGERAADKARLDWMEAQFADHNRDCNLTFNRFQYDQELSLDAEGASWSRMTIRSNLDAARGGEG